MENPIKMDDLGVPPFLETPNYPAPFPFVGSIAASSAASNRASSRRRAATARRMAAVTLCEAERLVAKCLLRGRDQLVGGVEGTRRNEKQQQNLQH